MPAFSLTVSSFALFQGESPPTFRPSLVLLFSKEIPPTFRPTCPASSLWAGHWLSGGRGHHHGVWGEGGEGEGAQISYFEPLIRPCLGLPPPLPPGPPRPSPPAPMTSMRGHRPGARRLSGEPTEGAQQHGQSGRQVAAGAWIGSVPWLNRWFMVRQKNHTLTFCEPECRDFLDLMSEAVGG